MWKENRGAEMSGNNRIFYFIFFGLATVCSFHLFPLHMLHAALADGQWPMFKNDLRHSGQSPYVGSQSNVLQWKFTLPAGIIAESPVIGPDGTIYLCTSGSVYAINKDGSQKWKSDVHPGATGGSTVALSSDGTIYAPFYHSLYALNSDGSIKWTYYSDTEIATTGPSIGTNGIIYVGSSLDLLAIEGDGNLLWKYRVGEEVRTSPAISTDETIIVRGRENYLVAINPDGSEKWTLDLGSGESHTYMAPVIGADGTIYTYGLVTTTTEYSTVDYTGLCAINQNGTVKWKLTGINLSAQMTPAATQNGNIYIAGKVIGLWNTERFFALNSTGNVLWFFDRPEDAQFSQSSPAVDVNGSVYFGMWGKNVYSLTPSGNLQWTYTTLNNIDSSPAIGSNGTIYVGSSDGYLYAIGKADPNAPTIPPYSVKSLVPMLLPLSLEKQD